MAQFNPDFWELGVDTEWLEGRSTAEALWAETAEDKERRWAFGELFANLGPAVIELVETKLTRRQKEVVKLHFILGKNQGEIAEILDLTQSTVSRHLFGTVRGGKKVGGAIPKLQKLVQRRPEIADAFSRHEENLSCITQAC